MVYIFDGNSEIDSRVRSNISYLVCLRHLIRLIAVSNRIFFPKRPIFLCVCATQSELPTTISIMPNPICNKNGSKSVFKHFTLHVSGMHTLTLKNGKISPEK